MPHTPGKRRGSEILADLVEVAREHEVTVDTVLERFGRRGFGVLLLLLTLTAFVPLPVGGGLFGPLIALLGLQIAMGMEHPWLPQRLRRVSFRHQTLVAALTRLTPIMLRLERLSRPAWLPLRTRAGEAVSGVALIVLGIALALPIPLTNFPLGVILLVFAIGLIEGDGRIIAACWAMTLAVLVIFAGLGEVLRQALGWFAG